MIDQFLSILGEIKALFQMIGEDGYLHLVMEPLFTYGIGFGLLLFIVALVARERMSRTFALLILMVSSVFIYPYQHKREESAPRTGYRENWTTESQELWDQQTARRQQFQYLYYLLALAALLNIVISPESLLGKGLAGMVLLGGTVVLICGLWLNLQEKRIFFRIYATIPVVGPRRFRRPQMARVPGLRPGWAKVTMLECLLLNAQPEESPIRAVFR